jgi:AmmeMemoRadiSam system protein A
VFKNDFLEIAWKAIANSFNPNVKVEKPSSELFEKEGATFVTLNIDGRLRGCIGSLVAHRILFDDLVHNAKAAAFGDPRFKPLTKDEFLNTDVEVSLLTPAVELPYKNRDDLKSKIAVGEDGVILKLDGKQATFLPQVWEQLPTFEQFFSHLCQKAGLDAGCIENHPTIYTYKVEKYK